MSRTLSNALKRWSSKGSAHDRKDVAHLCMTCQHLIITQDLLKGIPESRLENGSAALDLQQGFLDLPMKKEDHSPDFAELKDRVSSGCGFCISLLDAIERNKGSRKDAWTRFNDRDVIIKFRYCFGPDPGVGTFEAGQWPVMLAALEAVIHRKTHPKDMGTDDQPMVIAFKIHCESNSAAGDYLRIRRRLVEYRALSQSNLRKMKDWIQDCRHNHYACCPLANSWTPARPTRLMYVGDRGENIMPRLMLSSNLPKDARYAALSYCWGPSSSMRLTTTMDTLNRHLAGIPWEAVPPTIRDAFITARMLGLNYIWIDALCIIQNNTRDWDIEAAKMGDIYRGAQITIVAASSQSTNDGFLDRIPARYGVHIPFQSRLHESISGQYCLTYSEQGYKEEFGKDVEESTWNERGWTFQERQLSRRVLFFGKHRFYFECRMHWRSEDYERPVHRSLALYKQMQNTDDWNVLNYSWRKIIEEFSGREFTFARDRLPALSGLARDIISKANGDSGQRREYLAGHWRDSLVSDLTWIVETAEKSEPLAHKDYIPEQDTFRSPTWSWSNSTGKVIWLRHDQRAVLHDSCTIERASTKLLSQDPLGGVVAGFIDVVGPLAQVELSSDILYIAGTWLTIYEGHDRVIRAVQHGSTGPEPVWKLPNEDMLWQGEPGSPTYGIQLSFDEDFLAVESCWLAYTSRARESSGESWLYAPTEFFYGLILVPVRTKIQQQRQQAWSDSIESMTRPFRRVGMFRAMGKREVRHNWVYREDHYKGFEKLLDFRVCRYRIV